MKIGPFRLFESNPITNSVSKVVSNNYNLGESPEVTFEDLIRYHDCTPEIQIGVTAYAELITGTEMQINSENEKAKKIIEDWIQQSNFYDKFENMVNTLLICGNSILEKLDETKTLDVTEVDMRTISRKKRDQYGNTEWYEQRLEGGRTQKLGEGNLGRFIEFNLSKFSQGMWGNSLFYALAKSRQVGNRRLRPLVEIWWAAQDAMSTIIVNHAYPIRMITYEGANEAELEKESQKWKKFKPGDTILQTRKPLVEIFEAKGESKFTDYIDSLRKTIELGIKFPHDIMTGDFTSRASSETTESIVLKLTRGFQRYLANKLKQELFDPILLQNNINPQEALLTTSFTTQNITKLTPDQILSYANSKKISDDETREWLRDNTGIDLFDDDKLENEKNNNKLQFQKNIQSNAKFDKNGDEIDEQ